jgi:hypothetical protein
MKNLSGSRNALLWLACVALAACAARDANVAATAGSKPDFEGGVWLPQRGPRSESELPSYTPAVAERLAALGPIAPESLGNANCLPESGPTENMGEIFYSSKSIFIMKDEDFLSVRHIHLDAATHGDPDPSYQGHSIGRWEGDTLVIDTVALLPEVTIAPGVPGDGNTHIVERLRLQDANTLEQVVTIEDPGVLMKSWTRRNLYAIHRDLHVREAFCAQNNRDIPVAGESHTDLTPPPRGY